MASHVSQCMAKACMCDTWQAMCVTHGMPCVNMHGSLPCLYKGLTWAFGRGKGAANSVRGGAARRRRRKGGKEKRKGGKEMRKEKRKEKNKREEERKRKEEEEGVLHSEQIRTEKNPELRYKR